MLKVIVISAFFSILLASCSSSHKKKDNKLLKDLCVYADSIINEFDRIEPQRAKTLKELASYADSKIKKGNIAEFVFICSHNSRRSHMAQIWAQTAAYYYGFKNVSTYSGGTEASAFNSSAVRSLEKAGFQIIKKSGNKNPHYQIAFTDDMDPMDVFSKTFGHTVNPQQDFCAVMTCSQADEECPFVPGSDFRISLNYDDPKAFDGTEQEEEKYDERCRQIAREMFYLFSLLPIS